jgi:hypothetical protein
VVAENPTWGAPLKMLDFDLSERIVLRWMRKAPRNPQPATRWAAFLSNHPEWHCGTVRGSCRRELLDDVIVINEHHLKRLMNDYVRYYHEDRTHLGLAKETPGNRSAEKSAGASRSVISLPRLGGLHHRYQLAA